MCFIPVFVVLLISYNVRASTIRVWLIADEGKYVQRMSIRWGRFYSVFGGVWILYIISAFLRFWRNITPISPTQGISYAEVYVSTRPIVRKIRKKNQIRRWEADNQYIFRFGGEVLLFAFVLTSLRLMILLNICADSIFVFRTPLCHWKATF